MTEQQKAFNPDQAAMDAVSSIQAIMALGKLGAQKSAQIQDIIADTIRAALSHAEGEAKQLPAREREIGIDLTADQIKAVAAELARGAEALTGGEDDCDLTLRMMPAGTVQDDDGKVNESPVLALLISEYPEEGVYPIMLDGSEQTHPAPQVAVPAALEILDAIYGYVKDHRWNPRGLGASWVLEKLAAARSLLRAAPSHQQPVSDPDGLVPDEPVPITLHCPKCKALHDEFDAMIDRLRAGKEGEQS